MMKLVDNICRWIVRRASRINLRVVLEPGGKPPIYGKDKSSGMDLTANNDKSVLLKPGERAVIPLGVRIEIPEGYELQLRPRSGNAAKRGLGLVNSPGTIDAGFLDEIGAIVINLSQEDQVINPGERIAQGVMAKSIFVEEIEVVESFDDSIFDRRGGFGSSG
jgi:dUTP pyrophosphatase